MKSLFIIILFLSVQLSWAQDTLNFKSVDETTYRAYLNKEWNQVITIGEKALKQDIDYYFLRMRLGVAYFEKQNYRKAIVHFEKAKEMSSEDVVVIEYLYYAYKYIGNDIQALRTLDQSNTKFANKLLYQQTLFQDIYTFLGTRVYDADKLEDTNLPAFQKEIQNEKKPIYTQQYIPKSYINFQLGATIRFSPSWRLHASYQYFGVEKQQYILDPFRKTVEDSRVKQTQLNINNTFSLSNHLLGSVFFTYLSQKFDYIQINTSKIPTEYKAIKGAKGRDFLFGLGLNRRQTYFDIGFRLSAMFTTFPCNQIDLELKLFPLGNRKIISRTNISSLLSDTTGRKLIFSQELSYSPIERIQLSVIGNWGEMKKWNTNNAYNVYNDIYGISALYQAKLTLRLVNKLYVKLYYEYMENKSYIWSGSLLQNDNTNTYKRIEEHKFYTHSIIGGLIWEF